MKKICIGLGIVLLFILPLARASETGIDEAVQKLLDGNMRYVSGRLAKKDLGDEKRRELAKGQHPFAVVLTCADSRVAPELLFDQGIGDLFVIRAAGNVVDKIALGSMEYAVEHLHAPVILVLGHQSCGAVKAALEATGSPEGNIGEIIKKIKPAAIKAKNASKRDKSEQLDVAVQENVKNVYQEVLEKSDLVKEHVEEGKVKVLIGEYYLDTGKVQFLDIADEEAAEEESKARESKPRALKPARPFPTKESRSKNGSSSPRTRKSTSPDDDEH